MRTLALALLLAACSAPAHPTPTLQLPAAVQARWPDCTLDGWVLVGVPEPFTPPAGTLCGTAPCRGRVRGHTDTRTRRITVWALDPHLAQVIDWEGCNACRWEQTRVLRDGGCA